MSDIIISPSILSADFANLQNQIELITKAGADWVHVDVMDGHFVPNITIGAPVVKALKKVSDIPLDVHLMISEPEKYIDDFSAAGADIITIHYEAVMSKTSDILSKIKEKGIKAGLSIKPNTSPNEIIEFLDETDLVLIMTVEPGFGGQKFIRSCADKIQIIKKYCLKGTYIEVDGGINPDTAKICKDFGANALVAGNYIFKSTNIQNAINSLRGI